MFECIVDISYVGACARMCVLMCVRSCSKHVRKKHPKKALLLNSRYTCMCVCVCAAIANWFCHMNHADVA